MGGLTKEFVRDDGERTLAVGGVDLEVPAGGFVSLVGRSGCGKTTVLRMVAGLEHPTSGSVLVDDVPVVGPTPECGFVFQGSELYEWLTVEQNIAFGLKARGVYKGHEDEVRSYIERMGLTGFEDALPLHLSGGMAQRVALARALVNHPKVLLLDEPLGALDSFTRRAMQDELIGLWESEHVSMIMVTHDVDEAIHMSSQVAVMSPRPCEVVEVVDNPLRKTYEGDSPEFIEMRRHIRSLLEDGESH